LVGTEQICRHLLQYHFGQSGIYGVAQQLRQNSLLIGGFDRGCLTQRCTIHWVSSVTRPIMSCPREQQVMP
jgi:hypothetical protein